MAESAREKLIDLCRSGVLNPMDVLENVLINYMSIDDANDFAESEYDIHCTQIHKLHKQSVT